MKLLDVNVWLAAAWARHVHHAVARRYMDGEDDEMAFCRVTEAALLRLLTNRAVCGDEALTRRQAWDVLLSLQNDPRIKFIQEPRGLAPLWIAFSKRDDRSHQLWTDDYLAAFAQTIGAELVTLDGSVRTRYPSVDVRVLK
jgi:toxin-antitoxin system PIN domain toxin